MKIILNGSNGRMGREVIKLAEAGCRNAEIVAKVDITGEDGYRHISDVRESADCIVEFSSHLAAEEICSYAKKSGTPVVFASTGHTDEEKKKIEDLSRSVPVFFSANMSVGVALLVELAKKTAAAMPDADIEIVEVHHNGKLDAPSGTALMLADAIKQVRSNARLVLGRSGHARREKNDIGISSVRVGNIVGTHEVIVGTDTQTITIKHEAHSRALFAEGALSAAEFLIKQPAGLYTMQDMIAGA
ncbi:MAG: 4-hydroxy-tetrahydrodipicolinate reductase [Acutalibacteraceae bacterium]|nr:4-hydroxy-tetrahydrodipicolinate reductase [Oscillospiraceae bacterium]